MAFGAGIDEELVIDPGPQFVIAHLGRLPKRGESIALEGLRIQVLRADSRRVYTQIVEKPKA